MAYGTKQNDILLTIVYILVFLFVITTNIFWVYGIIQIRNKLSRIDWLFLFLAFCNMVEGALMMPIQIYLINKRAPITCFGVGLKTGRCYV